MPRMCSLLIVAVLGQTRWTTCYSEEYSFQLTQLTDSYLFVAGPNQDF